MSTARFIVGDSLTVLRSLPDASVDLVLSSPPFLALRSYLPADHPDKAKEIGSEATPGEFIDVLLDGVEECRRVLAPHGSLCFELGDTYSGSGGAGGDYNEGGLRESQQAFSGSAAKRRRLGIGDDYRPSRAGRDTAWPQDKSLTLIPESFRWALAYGRNPFTGRETEPWRVRNVIRWCRPNPPVGALGDKFRPATSEMVVACTSRRRYFDLDAVRQPAQDYSPRNGEHPRVGIPGRAPQISNAADENGHRIMANAAGAPPLDWWAIPTEPYKGSHYATWPTALLIKPIRAMCPERVCRVCGVPSERITGDVEYVKPDGRAHAFNGDGFETNEALANRRKVTGHDNGNMTRQAPTLGWTDCGHDDYRPGVVLDPFGGSGTTAAVATGHGRDALLIDLDARNADLARERCGMFLTVEHHAPTLNP